MAKLFKNWTKHQRLIAWMESRGISSDSIGINIPASFDKWCSERRAEEVSHDVE